MKRIIVNVPDPKLDEFIVAMHKIGIDSYEIEPDSEIPKWHKEIVRESIRNSKEEDYIPWEEVKRKLDLKYGLSD